MDKTVQINIIEMSTGTSTDFDSEIKRVKQSLDVVRQSSARSETIKALKKQLKDLKKRKTLERKYKDIRQLKSWPNQVLVERYDDATEYACKYESQVEGINLFSSDEDKSRLDHYKAVLRIIEMIEDEGRSRQILYFMSDNEKLRVIKDIFGEECEWSPTPTSVASKGGSKS